MNRTVWVFFLVLASCIAVAAPVPAAGAADDTQARAMVVFLRTVAAGQDAKPLIGPLMAMKGTALLIAQQNLMRRVTSEEYREVLLAVAEHRQPQLTVPDDDVRALKGKQGLLQDVLPSLLWGSQHTDLLAAQLAAAAGVNAGAEARKLALDNLPEPVPLDVPLYFVMGGRAGAAANKDGIYFDVLTNTYRDPEHSVKPTEVVEFFAHEMHHVGMEQILDRRESQLRLDADGERALKLLDGLVLEGSASYLINAHHDLSILSKDPGFAAPGNDASRLAAVQKVLTGVLQQHWTSERYEEGMAEFAGSTLHVTGATMLDAIWQAEGRPAVMEVLRDPRQLLASYNRSVAKHEAFRFPASLAQQVAAIGQ